MNEFHIEIQHMTEKNHFFYSLNESHIYISPKKMANSHLQHQNVNQKNKIIQSHVSDT